MSFRSGSPVQSRLDLKVSNSLFEGIRCLDTCGDDIFDGVDAWAMHAVHTGMSGYEAGAAEANQTDMCALYYLANVIGISI